MLVNIADLEKEQITKIVSRAKEFKQGAKANIDKTACMMFFENSTRTKCSFELAAKKLGMITLDFDAESSSLKKGESLKDTFENLYYIGVDKFVIRHKEDDFIKNVLSQTSSPIDIINAGTGVTSHPTQALLDYMTMTERINVEGKKVSIVGDISHSRVAQSNIALLSKFDVNINLIDTIKGETIEAIENSDVVMLLRVQKERFEYNGGIYPTLTSDILEKLAPKAILMHPAPVNRGVEISSELLDSQKGQTILEQARNGTYIRMAVLEGDY